MRPVWETIRGSECKRDPIDRRIGQHAVLQAPTYIGGQGGREI